MANNANCERHRGRNDWDRRTSAEHFLYSIGKYINFIVFYSAYIIGLNQLGRVKLTTGKFLTILRRQKRIPGWQKETHIYKQVFVTLRQSRNRIKTFFHLPRATRNINTKKNVRISNKAKILSNKKGNQRSYKGIIFILICLIAWWLVMRVDGSTLYVYSCLLCGVSKDHLYGRATWISTRNFVELLVNIDSMFIRKKLHFPFNTVR